MSSKNVLDALFFTTLLFSNRLILDDSSLSLSVDVPIYSGVNKQHPTDGDDSGIGSDSPKASKVKHQNRL